MKRRPSLITPTSLDVPQYTTLALPNGVNLHTVPCDDCSVVRFSFVFRAGTAVQSVPFAASATANMLCEGTRRYTSQQVAERLDYLGSYFDVNVDRDCVYISFCSLSRFFAETLDVAEQILLHPTFPEEELRTYAAKRRQRLEVDRMQVDVLAREELARCLFGEEHPYGRISPESAYDTLRRSDLESHYRRFYTAERCFVVCSGRVGDAELQAVSRIAAALPRGSAAETPFPQACTRHESRIVREGAVQSSIRMGRRLFTRMHPDFTGMQVVATALGGYFGSRLMQNLRERNGFTYGVVAAMVNFEREGYFAIATQVGADATERAVEEILRETELLGREPMPAAELDMVRNMMTGEMMRILDGPFGIADVTIENILCGTDNGFVERNLRRIREITPEQVCELAARYLRTDDMVRVVAGPNAR